MVVFAERVDFVYWWSFIGKGLHLQPAQQACYDLNGRTIRLIIVLFLSLISNEEEKNI